MTKLPPVVDTIVVRIEKCHGIYEACTKVIAYYHMICSYFIRFLVEVISRNFCQSSVFYLASSPSCGRGLLANSQKSFFILETLI